jgi:DNA repair protein RadC
MKRQVLASESFSLRNRHYFLDFKRAENNSNYIQITRSEQQSDGSYKRWEVIVFENQFAEFIQAFSSLFQSAAWYGADYKGMKEIHAEAKATKGIKGMAPEQRPRERLMALGANQLEDVELRAILIGSGTPNESSIVLAQRILAGQGASLSALKNMTLEQLCRFKGMGIAKSCTVLAALELAARLSPKSVPSYKPVYIYRPPGQEPGDFFEHS